MSGSLFPTSVDVKNESEVIKHFIKLMKKGNPDMDEEKIITMAEKIAKTYIMDPTQMKLFQTSKYDPKMEFLRLYQAQKKNLSVLSKLVKDAGNQLNGAQLEVILTELEGQFFFLHFVDKLDAFWLPRSHTLEKTSKKYRDYTV